MNVVRVSRVNGEKMFEIEAGVTDKSMAETLLKNGWSRMVRYGEFYVAEWNGVSRYYVADRCSTVTVPVSVSGHTVYVGKCKKVSVNAGGDFTVACNLPGTGVHITVQANTREKCMELYRKLAYDIVHNSEFITV